MTDSHLDKLFDALKGLTRNSTTNSPDSAAPTTQATYLFIGLGNPGREYRDTRHNIGFMTVDLLAERLGATFSRTQAKALITDGIYQEHKIILAKPQTFMNSSGFPTRALMKFYKCEPAHILIIYDDVDLPFDTIRLKPGGGSAGHKGMRSIIEQIGTQEFPRLRLGVGHTFGNKQAADYVLKPLSKEESEFLGNYLQRAADAALAFIGQGIDKAMSTYNRNA